MIGETLGTYRLVEKLGEGGMGEVYRAHDEMLDRDVALKMLRPGLARRPQTAERFRAEAITLAKLDHPGIARIHGASRHGELWFIVMELVRGETLQARLRRAGRLHWTETVPILCQLLDALEYAHRLGVVHRDMKPANVLVGPDGRVKVTDFGIARVLGTERATRTGHVVGTLEYMAPEQVRGEEVDGRTDLYAVGIVLHELLTGATPFQGSGEYDVMMQHLQAPIPSVRKGAPDAPTWFDAILQRALAKSRAERFATASEFQGAMETLASSEAGMQVRPPQLIVPKATQPEAPPGPTRLASTVGLSGSRVPLDGDDEAATVLGTGSNPAIPAPQAPPLPPVPPPTRLAANAPPATRLAAPPPMPSLPPPVVATRPPQPINWRLLSAVGAILLVVAVLGAFGIYRMLARPVVTTAADAGQDVKPPKPKPPIYDAPDPGVVTPSPGMPTPSPDTGMPPSGGRKLTLPTPGGGAGGSSPGGASPGGSGPAPGPSPLEPAPSPPPAAPAPSEGTTPPPKPEEAAPAPTPTTVEANAVEIDEVAMMVGSEARREEKEVIVYVESHRIVIRDADSEEIIRAVPFRGLDATYARTRYPVNKADRDRPAYVQGVAKGGGLFRRVPHWLTLEGSGAPVVFKLDGGQAEKIVGLLEGRGSVKVERVSEK